MDQLLRCLRIVSVIMNTKCNFSTVRLTNVGTFALGTERSDMVFVVQCLVALAVSSLWWSAFSHRFYRRVPPSLFGSISIIRL
jgi:hypothetical protein